MGNDWSSPALPDTKAKSSVESDLTPVPVVFMTHAEVVAEIERVNQRGIGRVETNQTTRDAYWPLFRQLAALDHETRVKTLRCEHARMKRDYDYMPTPATRTRLLSGFVTLAVRMMSGVAFDRTIVSSINAETSVEEMYWDGRRYQLRIYPTGRMQVEHDGVVPHNVNLLDVDAATLVERWL